MTRSAREEEVGSEEWEVESGKWGVESEGDVMRVNGMERD